MKTIACISAMAVAMLVAWQTAGATPTGTAYAVTLSVNTLRNESTGPDTDVLVKGSFTTANIINLARGRSPGAAVPANERLALELFFVSEDSPPVAALAVYDVNGQTNLAVIAELWVTGAFETAKGKGAVAMVGEIEDTGTLDGGWLSLVGPATVTEGGSEPTIAAFSGNVQGAVFVFGDSGVVELILTKGKIKLTGTLGPVYLGPPPPLF